MKVFVDKMPKCCDDCPCKDVEMDFCQLMHINNLKDCRLGWNETHIKIGDKCPLQSLPKDEKWDKLKDFIFNLRTLYEPCEGIDLTEKERIRYYAYKSVENKMTELEGESDE